MRFFALLALCCTLLGVSNGKNWDENTIMHQLNDLSVDNLDEFGLSMFRDALDAAGLLNQLLGDASGANYTVFAPTNGAIKRSPELSMYMKGMTESPFPRWNHNLKQTLMQHIIVNETLSQADIFDQTKSYLKSMHDGDSENSTIVVSQWSRKVGGASIKTPDYFMSNGVMHVVDEVFKADFMHNTFSMLELQPEFGPDVLDRVALTDVVDFVRGRETLNIFRESGMTFAGCRIRAFNRLEEYLPQTINYSRNVTYGEFLNESFREETRRNFIEYMLIPKNYYFDQIPDGYTELAVPYSNEGQQCGHMWITKTKGVLCFNNGCTIETPDIRTYLASNGVGYVLDKCQLCQGVAMLANIAAEYTVYNLRDTSQFFVASEWNLRDLRQSVGNGSDITLFASINTGWDFFNLEDVTRLASDKWDPHKKDLLRHNMVQGRYTNDKLIDMYNENGGPFNMTSLANQTLRFDYDDKKKVITLEGGDLFFADIQGVDGLLHFTNEVALPFSVTHTVYDFGAEFDKFSTQTTLIDTVYLKEDMKRLLPLTGFFAPNEKWTGLRIDLEEISKSVLENMIFKELLWCDTLRGMEGRYAESHNQRYWNITVNKETNMPCFTYVDDTGANYTHLRACVTKCDVLVRNGLAHEIDNVLLFEDPETAPPNDGVAVLPGMSGDDWPEFVGPTGAGVAGTPGAENSGAGFYRPISSLDDLTGFGDDEEKGAGSSATSVSLAAGAISAILFALIQP